MTDFVAGDVVVSKLHAGDRKHSRMMHVETVRPTGKIVVVGQGGRRMSFPPHALCLVRRG